MPRGPRISYPGAVFHVINRFVDKHPFFRNSSDRELFLEIYFEVAATFNIRTFAYHIMPNHFHFVIMTSNGDLSRFLQRFLTRAVQRLNEAHKRSGHLLQGRTKTLLVDETVYFDTVMGYVLTNGTRAGLARSVIEDKHSSVSEMLAAGDSRLDRLTLWPILFGMEFNHSSKRRALMRCEKWLMELDGNVVEEKFRQNHRGSFLGSREFRTKILDSKERRAKTIPGNRSRKTDRKKHFLQLPNSWAKILKTVEMHLNEIDWQSRWKSRTTAARHLGWYIAVQGGGWRYAELRERMNEPGVSHSRYTMAITEIRRDPVKRKIGEEVLRRMRSIETVKLSE